MKQTEFEALCPCIKLSELTKHGTYLEYIIKGPYMVKLFQYENFYVETYLHIQKDRIDSILNFDNTNKLTPYLKKIKLVLPPPQKKYCLDCPELACPENSINSLTKN